MSVEGDGCGHGPIIAIPPRLEKDHRASDLVSMWQKRDDDDDDLFYIVGEWALEEMSQHLRRWIELARTLGKMRSE